MNGHLSRRVTASIASATMLAVAWGSAPVATAVSRGPDGVSGVAQVDTALVHPDRRKRVPLAVGVPPGPASPTSPDTDSRYWLLSHGKCTDLIANYPQPPADDSSRVSLAAAEICSAAQHRTNDVDWAAVTELVESNPSLTDCLDKATLLAVKGAIALHPKQPEAPASFAKAPPGLACTPVPTQVLLVQDSPSGSPILVILGQRLFEVKKVKIGSTWLSASSRNAQEGTDCARVDVPAATGIKAGDVLQVRIRGRGYTTTVGTWSVDPPMIATQEDAATPPNVLFTTQGFSPELCQVSASAGATTP